MNVLESSSGVIKISGGACALPSPLPFTPKCSDMKGHNNMAVGHLFHCSKPEIQATFYNRVRIHFQKQISRTRIEFSKIHINPYTPKISMLILLTAFHTLHIFNLSLTDIQNFPRPVAFFQDFPVLENAIKFQDFPGFPGPIQTLLITWGGFAQ